MRTNARWEKFAQKIVEGIPQADAYQKIYKCKKRKTAETGAADLMVNPKFAEVYQKYQKKLVEKHENLAEETINELKTLAFSDITEVADVDKNLYVNLRADKLSKLPPQVRRTIQSYDINRTSGGSEEHPIERVTFKFKLHDKLGALNTLTKVLGITQDDGKEDELIGLTNKELCLLLAKTLREIAEKRGNMVIPIKAINAVEE